MPVFLISFEEFEEALYRLQQSVPVVQVARGAGELTVTPRTGRFTVASGLHLAPTR